MTLGEWRHSRVGRRVVRAWRVACAPREFAVRGRAARRLPEPRPGELRIDPRTGWTAFTAEDVPGARDVAAAAASLAARCEGPLRGHFERAEGRDRLVAELASDDVLARESALVRFALQDAILLPVSRYLRTVPYLARVSVPVSSHLAGASEPAYFQRFHLDNDDATQVKLYLNAHALEEQHGPLTFLPADESARVLEALRRRGRTVGRATTFSDADVLEHADPARLVRVVGPAGSGTLVDLSRCLHYGSRVQAGRRRVVLGACYLRYHRMHENPSNRLRAAADPGSLAELALRAPNSRAAGIVNRLADLERAAR